MNEKKARRIRKELGYEKDTTYGSVKQDNGNFTIIADEKRQAYQRAKRAS